MTPRNRARINLTLSDTTHTLLRECKVLYKSKSALIDTLVLQWAKLTLNAGEYDEAEVLELLPILLSRKVVK